MSDETYLEDNCILVAFGPDAVWRIYHQPGDVGMEYFVVVVTTDGVAEETYRTAGSDHLDWLDAVVRVGVDIGRQVKALEAGSDEIGPTILERTIVYGQERPLTPGDG